MNKRCRIVFLVTTLSHGGTERNLVQYCTSLDKKKYHCEVWYLHDTETSYKTQLQDAGIQINCLHSPKGFNIWFLLKTAQKLKHCGADLIHVFLPTVAYHAVTGKFLFRSKIPVLFSSGGIGIYLPFQRQIMRFGIGRYCYPIICNSLSVKDFWQQQLKVDERRLRVIPNGHDLSQYEKPVNIASVRSSVGLAEQDFVITTVGRMLETKRYGDMIDAFYQVYRMHANVRFIIIGEGDKDGYVQKVHKLGLEHVVDFLGHRTDVVDLLKASDVFLFGSESEGLPNAVIEAALCKIPIVATNIEPVQSVVENGISAILTNVRDPSALAAGMQKIMGEKEFGRRLATNAYNGAVEKFELSSIIAQLERAYQDAILGFEKMAS